MRSYDSRHAAATVPDRVRQRARTAALLIALAGAVMAASGSAWAETATPDEAQHVAANWLTLMVHDLGPWAGDAEPRIIDVQTIAVDDIELARCFRIAPRGYVIVPVMKELPPVQAYSDDSDFDVNQTEGFPRLLREVLKDRADLFVQHYGSLDAVQPTGDKAMFGAAHRDAWDRFTLGPEDFRGSLEGRDGDPPTQGGPLLTTAWHQGWPYNKTCPMGDGGQAVVGCVATAAAQLLKYHNWPPFGAGDYSYLWNGDNSCGGGTPGEELYADFSDPFNWAAMPDNCDGGCSTTQQNALAELSYELGVAYEMDYGACGSGAYTDDAIWILPTHFRYMDTVVQKNRNAHNASSWFNLIRGEIAMLRPMLYTFYGPGWGHAIVCDGWRLVGGLKQYHMNYGWADSHTAWYTIDEIAYTIDPMAESLISGIEYDFCATVTYDVYFGTTNPPTTLVCTGLAEPECDPGPLAPNTTYYWQVVATNHLGTGTSPVWTFSTGEGWPDCNENGVPDSQDIGAGFSEDCNANSIPDECEPDADGDGVPNACDVCPGGDDGVDTDGDGVPNGCDACPQDNPNDPDGDGVCTSADNCNLFNPNQTDCQPNGIGDVCDIAEGTSTDTDGDGVPDECAPAAAAAPLPEDSLGLTCSHDDQCPGAAGCVSGICYVGKSRYLSIRPDPSNAGMLTARRVSLDLGGGQSVVLGWVSAPQAMAVVGPEPSPQLLARLVDSGQRHYRDWCLDDGGAPWVHDVLHLGDCEVSPGYVYLIQSIAVGADVDDEGSYSEPLVMRTATLFGDVVGHSPGTPPDDSRDFKDIAAVVRGFASNQTEPKVRLDLMGSAEAPEVPDFTDISFRDINWDVKAFQGATYPLAAPCDCPGQACP